MQEQIASFLKQNGPSTHFDIASGTHIDSLIVSAVLSEMGSKNAVKISNKRLGSTRIYYLPGQHDAAKVKIFKSLEQNEQNFLKELQKRKVIIEGDFPMEVISEFGDFLLEFTYGGKRAWYWFEISSEEALKCLGKHKAPTKTEAKLVKKIETVEAPKPLSTTYLQRVTGWLGTNGALITHTKEVSKNEWEVEVSLQTPLGNQTYLVMVKDPKKKKLGTADVSEAYAKAVEKKMPVILVGSKGVTKSAEKFWDKGYKNLITLVDGKDM